MDDYGDSLGLEPLLIESNDVDFEKVLFEELLYEGEYLRVLNAKRPQLLYNGTETEGWGEVGSFASWRLKHFCLFINS